MAEDQDESQKTEEPTGKKLSDARRRGQVATSQEIRHAFMLFGALIVVAVLSPLAAREMTGGLGAFIETIDGLPVDRAALFSLLRGAMVHFALILLLPLITLVLVAVAGTLVQHGWLVSGESLKPNLSKINPLAGFKRLFSMRSLVEFAKGLLKITVVGVVATLVILPELQGIESWAGSSIAVSLERLWWLAVQMIMAVLAVMVAVGGLDYLYQRFEFMKQQRMTRQEVKDEHKQSEGDPLIKGRIRQIRMERTRRRMMAAVPDADVVITNPTHFAVAMKYAPEIMAAPVVVAKGVDHIALAIRALAEEHGVTVVENPPLARALHQAVEIDHPIPPEHYKAVAEIISFVFRLQRRVVPDSARMP